MSYSATESTFVSCCHWATEALIFMLAKAASKLGKEGRVEGMKGTASSSMSHQSPKLPSGHAMGHSLVSVFSSGGRRFALHCVAWGP
mmetsp:Transcript_27663/g.65692  ORF Transcript_27663/g.65692 Transcript_27663/m.65692 type:complete len:87 (-) Transcript_27663:2836-3096(-)